MLDPRSAGEHIILWVMLIAAGKVLVYGDRIAGANNLGAVESKCATVDTAAGGGTGTAGSGEVECASEWLDKEVHTEEAVVDRCPCLVGAGWR